MYYSAHVVWSERRRHRAVTAHGARFRRPPWVGFPDVVQARPPGLRWQYLVSFPLMVLFENSRRVSDFLNLIKRPSGYGFRRSFALLFV